MALNSLFVQCAVKKLHTHSRDNYALDVLCSQLTRDLFAIAKFLFNIQTLTGRTQRASYCGRFGNDSLQHA